MAEVEQKVVSRRRQTQQIKKKKSGQFTVNISNAVRDDLDKLRALENRGRSSCIENWISNKSRHSEMLTSLPGNFTYDEIITFAMVFCFLVSDDEARNKIKDALSMLKNLTGE